MNGDLLHRAIVRTHIYSPDQTTLTGRPSGQLSSRPHPGSGTVGSRQHHRRNHHKLNETIQHKVLSALSGSQILQVVHKLSAHQRDQLISHLEVSVITGVVLPSLNENQLARLLEALLPETLVTLTKRLTPQQVLDTIKRLTPHDLVAVLKLLTDAQVTDILTRLPREGVQALATATGDARLTQLMTPEVCGAVDVTGVQQLQRLHRLCSTMSFLSSAKRRPAAQGHCENSHLLTRRNTVESVQTKHELSRRSLADLLVSSPSAVIPSLLLLASINTVVDIIIELRTNQRKVLNALSGSQLMEIFRRLSPQLLARVLEAILPENFSILTRKLTPLQMLDVMKKLTPHDLVAVLNLLTDAQVTDILTRLPRESIQALAAATADARLTRLMTPEVYGAVDVTGVQQFCVPQCHFSLLQIVDSAQTNDELSRRSLADLLASSSSALIPGLVLLAPASTIVEIITELNETIQHKVLSALSGSQILHLVHRLSSHQRDELISHLEVSVITGVVLPSLNENQLARLMEALLPETLVTLTTRLTPQQVLDTIKRLTAHDLVSVLNLLTDAQVTDILTRLPREGVQALATTTGDARLTRLMTPEVYGAVDVTGVQQLQRLHRLCSTIMVIREPVRSRFYSNVKL
ncbi:hypothetical protein C0Q70_04226 [Pomacea canaliculata]|uniref:Magnesium transporter MgtE intracellular domain-containing protein n=1 Tax=Pomacea canaliculata TaxID=400727 RepID=A0A2T7PUY9_POMCA|nr:hypothetical protein C0Q70_04226 [Pomacea canaliculata]